MTSLVPGAEIAGYRLEEVLGTGGMGVVWRAKQIALDRPVALKVLAGSLAADQEFRSRFEREAKLAARIRHPNVVIVHDARQDNGVLVLAMELVRGTDLAQLLRDQGPLDATRAVNIVEQIAAALDAAHAEGLVHRDVKPANVLIAADGQAEHAYLTDFGLTKALAEAGGKGMTRQGMIVGTPEYMAPEQVRGEPVDARADVYALGCLLFEVLTGSAPYQRDTEVATLLAHANDRVPSLHEAMPSLPAELDEVVVHALAKTPDARFASAGELARAARAAVDGIPASPGTPALPGTPVSPARRAATVVDDAAWMGHVIVAGLGTTGSRLALRLDDAGYRVVAIELDGSNERIGSCRKRGIPVLVGDAAEPDLLTQARIAQATHLVATCGDDGQNLNVATVADSGLGADRSDVLTAFVHLADIALLRAMKLESLRGAGRGDFRLECFNPYLTGCRLLLDRHPAFEDTDGALLPSPRICVVGHDTLATILILLLAAEWRQVRTGVNRLPVMIAGPNAPEHVAELLSRYPQLADLCDLEPRQAEIQSTPFQSGELLLSPDGECAVTRTYVALPDESEALEAAVGLHGQPATESVPVVVALADDTSPMANVLRAKSRGFTQRIEPFGVLSAALAPTLLIRGVNELLARANHQTYLREQRAQGVTQGASVVPWDELPESLKASNRRFADGITAALDAVGASLVPADLTGAENSPVVFDDDELERLARREHERWMADLIRDGWRFREGEKDPEQKLHPLLVPWDELSETERDKDRDAVRALPEILTRAGFEVIRPRARAESGGGAPSVSAREGVPPGSGVR